MEVLERDPGEVGTTPNPILHCSATWRALAAAGIVLPNCPVQPETWAALRGIEENLLRPLEERYGVVTLTYGFAPERRKPPIW